MHPSRPLRRGVLIALLLALVLPGSGQAIGPVPGAATGEEGSGPVVRLPRAAGAGGTVAWSDVPRAHWARAAIDHVAGTNVWMRDFRPAAEGTFPFRPDRLERRSLFARAVVRAFAPAEPVDPGLTFSDVPADTRAHGFANVAVKMGWMQAVDGGFFPDQPVTPRMVHRALIMALGLAEEAAGLDRLHTRNGHVFRTPADFGALLLGMRLGLRYDHRDDALDVGPDTPLTRAEVAWSLYRATTASESVIAGLDPFASIELPALGPSKLAVVQFAVDYVGYPYVWGGEWDTATPGGYCCGSQPVGGFDCSGLMWWTLKLAAGGWNNVPPRTYPGWSLGQRSSADMASTGLKVVFEQLKPGDLMFYDGNADGRVDHVNLYLGNGWALDSSGGSAGVSIVPVTTEWYRDGFTHGRRIIA